MVLKPIELGIPAVIRGCRSRMLRVTSISLPEDELSSSLSSEMLDVISCRFRLMNFFSQHASNSSEISYMYNVMMDRFPRKDVVDSEF